jgi:hypothetical protein
MWGWILVIGMGAVMLTAWLRRAGSAAPDDHETLYPQGYMVDEVEALKRGRQ